MLPPTTRSFGRLLRHSAPLSLLVLLALACGPRLTVRVTLRNVSPRPLLDARLLVTGRTYALGVVRPGETRVVVTHPTSDTHVEFEHGLPGHRMRVRVDCYFTPGMNGSLTFGTDGVRALSVSQTESIIPAPYASKGPA